jgi:DNA-binding NtrC family response regulator
MERMAVLSKGEELGLGDVPAPLRAAVAGGAGGGAGPGASAEGDGGRGTGKMEDARRAAEKATVAAALAKCGGNRAAAARELGVSRRTLYRKMEEYGLAAALPAGKPGA